MLCVRLCFVCGMTSVKVYFVCGITNVSVYFVCGVTNVRVYFVLGITNVRVCFVHGMTNVRVCLVRGTTSVRVFCVLAGDDQPTSDQHQCVCYGDPHAGHHVRQLSRSGRSAAQTKSVPPARPHLVAMIVHHQWC